MHELILMHNTYTYVHKYIHACERTHLYRYAYTLQTLPTCMIQMTSLQALSLVNNALINLDPRMGLLNLRAFLVDGNPLKQVYDDNAVCWIDFFFWGLISM